jgi:hypothetical protein
VKAANNNNGIKLKSMKILNNGAQTRDNGAIIRLAAGDYLAVGSSHVLFLQQRLYVQK